LVLAVSSAALGAVLVTWTVTVAESLWVPSVMVYVKESS
jgi:hypothetical protein